MYSLCLLSFRSSGCFIIRSQVHSHISTKHGRIRHRALTDTSNETILDAEASCSDSANNPRQSRFFFLSPSATLFPISSKRRAPSSSCVFPHLTVLFCVCGGVLEKGIKWACGVGVAGFNDSEPAIPTHCSRVDSWAADEKPKAPVRTPSSIPAIDAARRAITTARERGGGVGRRNGPKP